MKTLDITLTLATVHSYFLQIKGLMPNSSFCLLFFVFLFIVCFNCINCGGGGHSKPPIPDKPIIYSYALHTDGSFILLDDGITILIFQD